MVQGRRDFRETPISARRGDEWGQRRSSFAQRRWVTYPRMASITGDPAWCRAEEIFAKRRFRPAVATNGGSADQVSPNGGGSHIQGWLQLPGEHRTPPRHR